MSVADSTHAAERTQLARLRTAIGLIVVSALVARLAFVGSPVIALPCAAVATVGLVLAVRHRRAPTGARRAAVLSASVMLLAVAALLSLL